MTTEERLEKLEQELAHTNRRNRWLLAFVVLVAGLLALAWTWTQTTAVAQAPGDIIGGSKIVRGTAFILEDENGNPRGTLSVNKDGPGLRLYDENGRQRALLSVSKTGTALMLGDENQKIRATLAAMEDGPTLNLMDESGKTRAWLNVTKLGLGLVLLDENGKKRATLGAHQTVSPDGTETKHPESSLCLFGPDGKTLWSAP